MKHQYTWIGTRIVLKFSSFYSHIDDVTILTKTPKIQGIQSTNDGINCKQEILLNGTSIWSRTLSCPEILTETQQIYLSGTYSYPDVEVRNFQFFTHPL